MKFPKRMTQCRADPATKCPIGACRGRESAKLSADGRIWPFTEFGCKVTFSRLPPFLIASQWLRLATHSRSFMTAAMKVCF